MTPRQSLLSIILLLTCLSAGAQSTSDIEKASGMSPERLMHIDRVFGEYVDQGRLPGATYAVNRNGVRVYTQSLGPHKRDSLYRIYSMTKPITIVAVLMLYEEGRFLLSDPVSRYLPEYTNMQVYAGVDLSTEEIQTKPAEKPITIEHLLMHTAGLTYGGSPNPVSQAYSKADFWAAPTLAEFSHRLAKLPLAFEPGSRWEYGVSMDVLGRLVEVVSQQRFDAFLRKRIFEPLQMNDTGFHVPDSKVNRFLDQYSRDGDGMKVSDAAAESRYLNKDGVPYGGHGLVSTIDDYMRFTQMLVNNGELDGHRILGRKTVELMTMNHMGPEYGPVPLDASWVGRTENRRADPNVGIGFGYGGYVITNVAQNAVPGTPGTYSWGGAASTYFFVDRKEKLTGVFLTQLRPSDSYPLRAQFRGLVYQAIVD